LGVDYENENKLQKTQSFDQKSDAGLAESAESALLEKESSKNPPAPAPELVIEQNGMHSEASLPTRSLPEDTMGNADTALSILLVDDNSVNLRVKSTFFYELTSITNCSVALSSIHEEK
jgi:hypothetical protein